MVVKYDFGIDKKAQQLSSSIGIICVYGYRDCKFIHNMEYYFIAEEYIKKNKHEIKTYEMKLTQK